MLNQYQAREYGVFLDRGGIYKNENKCNELGDLEVGWDPNPTDDDYQVLQRTQTQSSDGIMT